MVLQSLLLLLLPLLLFPLLLFPLLLFLLLLLLLPTVLLLLVQLVPAVPLPLVLLLPSQPCWTPGTPQPHLCRHQQLQFTIGRRLSTCRTSMRCTFPAGVLVSRCPCMVPSTSLPASSLLTPS